MGPFTLIRGSVYAVYTVPYCAALLIVSEYRGDRSIKYTRILPCVRPVRAAVWECQCGKDLMREPAFYLAFDNDNDWVRPPSRERPVTLIRSRSPIDTLLNFWK